MQNDTCDDCGDWAEVFETQPDGRELCPVCAMTEFRILASKERLAPLEGLDVEVRS